ncbi:MAG: type II toxin-antitoxin system RelE/ParE family toxin [Planctomycetales bacterium]|nr:type II toxin-antitoxin system RelE/ParE family toxin [Planctomycetales bacterium]
MNYTVELTERATNDIRQAYKYIRQHGPAHPDDWKRDLERKLISLEMLPEACGFALENDYCSAELRQTFHGPFRIVFTIRETTVHVLTVRHGARRPLSRRDVRQSMPPT